MSSAEDPFWPDVVAGAVGMIPIVGSGLAPFAERLACNLRDEWRRNSSKALHAAEQVSGMSREELADAIAEDRRLLPLITRVLYSAGMAGQDEVLIALGTAFGDAVRDRSYIDEAELLLIVLTDLRPHHIAVLRELASKSPGPVDNKGMSYWNTNLLADRTGYRQEVVRLCTAGLANGGLVQTMATYGGGAVYEISELGRTVLEVLQRVHNN